MNAIKLGVAVVDELMTVTCWTMYVYAAGRAMFCSPYNGVEMPFALMKFVFGFIQYGELAVVGCSMKVNMYDCWGVVGRSVMARVVVAVEFEVSVYTIPVRKLKVCAAANVAETRESEFCLAHNSPETDKLDTLV